MAQSGSRGWRDLGLFWAVVVLVAGGTAGVLQYLGPPAEPVAAVAQSPARTPEARIPDAHSPDAPASIASAPASQPPVPQPGQIMPPQAALLEPSKLFPPAMLPRIAADGRVARVVYARPVEGTDPRPKVAVVITGLGMSESESRLAIQTLPGPISLSFSPYSAASDALLDLSRKSGHEMILSLPLEPQGFPQNDAGSKSLLSGATPQQNAANLEWVLSRIQGYVGAIGALDAMRGERFAETSSNLRLVLDELSRRGLLYVDPRPGKTVDKLSEVPGRGVDVVIDDPPARAEIEGKLAGLERVAREKGSAIGFAGPLRPMTVERVAAWARSLGDRGIALVPVSALINPASGK